jgi:hypothetical protein
LGQGTHVVCPSDADAGDEEEAGKDALAVAVTDSDAALAPDNDVMASTPMTAATIPERAIIERRLIVIIFQPPGRMPSQTHRWILVIIYPVMLRAERLCGMWATGKWRGTTR